VTDRGASVAEDLPLVVRVAAVPRRFTIVVAIEELLRFARIACCSSLREGRSIMGRGILLWLLGVPIPVIILLALIWR
jgi:hypothetical protein